MVSLIVIILVLIFAFILPGFYPYTYEQQIRGSENLAPMQYSEAELALRAEGQSVFPHFMGTDTHSAYEKSMHAKESITFLRKKYGENVMELLLWENPMTMVEDEHLNLD
jgi:hypothetical protein